MPRPWIPQSATLRSAFVESSRSVTCFRCARQESIGGGFARAALRQQYQQNGKFGNGNGRRYLSFSRRLRDATAGVDEQYFWPNAFSKRTADSASNSNSNSNGGHNGKLLASRGEHAAAKDSTLGANVPPSTASSPSPSTANVSPQSPTPAESIPSPRPRARRKKAITTTTAANGEDGQLSDMPLDASAQLSQLAAQAKQASFSKRFFTYLALTKPRLAFLVVLTCAAGYSLYPVPSLLSTAATHTPSLSSLTLLFLTTGTFGTIASANTLNMLFEPRYDAQMSRTRNRPLARGLIRPRAALAFAVLTGLAGTGVLWFGVNPTTAVLGAGNLVLYAFVYTPLKRISVVNTWIGAVVGAVPPLMGWCAAGGQYAPSAPSFVSFTGAQETVAGVQGLWDEMSTLLLERPSVGGWFLAALLFAWQFPHFNALSHPIRHEYASAGYRMLVFVNPAMNTRVALRYSLAMFPICVGLSYYGVTDRYFVLTSSVINGWMAKQAWQFWRSGGGESKEAAKTARGLFWASVWHLPIVLLLAMAHKKGLWDGLWRTLTGDGDALDDDEWEDEE